MRTRICLLFSLSAVLTLSSARPAHASGGVTDDQAALIGAVLLAVPQIPAVASTSYYLLDGPRPQPVLWGVYNLLAGGVTVAAAGLYAREDQWGYAVPFALMGGVEVACAAWAFFSAASGDEGPDAAVAASESSVRLAVHPRGAALSLRF